MDRSIAYSNEQIRLFDWLQGQKDVLKGLGRVAQAMLGTNATIISGLSASQQPTPNLMINLAEGQIYQWLGIDLTTYGNLSADASFVYQQGYTPAQTLTLSTAQLSSGQEQWVLVQCTFLQSDAIRTGDPTNGVLPYYNSANPTVPLQGPGGGGGNQPSVRQGIAQVSLVYGTPAGTGLSVPPNPGANNVPLYLIKLSFGQTAITTGQILKAGPNAYSGYQSAPFCNGLLAQHHLGGTGMAPKIDLTAEVQNILPLANLPCSNASPPTAGGNIVVGGELPVFSQGSVNPNSNVAGQLSDLYFQQGANLFFICTTAGNAASAVWAQVGLSGGVQYINSFPFNSGFKAGWDYLLDSGNSAASIVLPAASSISLPMGFKSISSGVKTFTPATGESIEFQAANATYSLNTQGQGVRLIPRSGVGWYIG